MGYQNLTKNSYITLVTNIDENASTYESSFLVRNRLQDNNPRITVSATDDRGLSSVIYNQRAHESPLIIHRPGADHYIITTETTVGDYTFTSSTILIPRTRYRSNVMYNDLDDYNSNNQIYIELVNNYLDRQQNSFRVHNLLEGTNQHIKVIATDDTGIDTIIYDGYGSEAIVSKHPNANLYIIMVSSSDLEYRETVTATTYFIAN